MITLFWIFVIIGVALLGMVILPRQRHYTWGWNVLVVLAIVYFGFYKLTGTPRAVCMLSSLGGLRGDYQIVYHSEVPNKAIYLLLQTGDTPLFLETEWTSGRATSIKRAAMQADRTGGVLMVRAEMLSQCGAGRMDDSEETKGANGNQTLGGRKGANMPKQGTEGGEATFYAQPVETDPLKLPPQTVIEVR